MAAGELARMDACAPPRRSRFYTEVTEAQRTQRRKTRSQNQFMSLRHRTEIPGCGAAYAGMAPSAGSLCRFLSLAPAARKSARTRRALAAAAMRAPLR